MATLTTLPTTIVLTSEQSGILQELVATGRFASPEAAIAHSIEMLTREACSDDLTPEIEARLSHSLAQAKRGELVSGDRVMARLETFLNRLEAR